MYPVIFPLSRKLFCISSEIEFFLEGPGLYLSAANNDPCAVGESLVIWETPTFLWDILSSLSGGIEFLLFVFIFFWLFDFCLTLTGSLVFLVSVGFTRNPEERLDPLLKLALDLLPVLSFSLLLKIQIRFGVCKFAWVYLLDGRLLLLKVFIWPFFGCDLLIWWSVNLTCFLLLVCFSSSVSLPIRETTIEGNLGSLSSGGNSMLLWGPFFISLFSVIIQLLSNHSVGHI